MSGLLTYDEKVEVTRKIFRIFAEWEIPIEDMPRLLGFRAGMKRRELNRYRLGTPLPEDPGVYQRVGLFLEIDNALHKLFPHSGLSANLWVTTPRVKFGNETPLALMLRRDFDGIRIVRDSLQDSTVW